MVLESEGSKCISCKNVHVLSENSLLFMYFHNASMHNMNGPSGVIYVETAKYAILWARFN